MVRAQRGPDEGSDELPGGTADDVGRSTGHTSHHVIKISIGKSDTTFGGARWQPADVGPGEASAGWTLVAVT
jgi:hypothetical protein